MFGDLEAEFEQASRDALKGELFLVEGLLEALDRLLKDLGTVDTNSLGTHRWVVMLFLGQNLNLLHNALNLALRGYAPEVMILIRAALERVVLSMFFIEFPEEEESYRTEGYRIFYQKHPGWIEGLLTCIDKEGCVFKVDSTPNYWTKSIYTYLMEEANKFSHPSEGYVYGAMAKQIWSSGGGVRPLVMGPQRLDQYTTKLLVMKIVQSLLWSLLVLQKGLELGLLIREIELIGKSVKFVKETQAEYAREEPLIIRS